MIVLRGGGQVTGKVLPDPENKDRVQVWLLQGRKPLSFLKSQIVEVTPKASPLDAYFEKVKKVAATAQAQYDLGTLVRAEQAYRSGEAALRGCRSWPTSRSSRRTGSSGTCFTTATGSAATT